MEGGYNLQGFGCGRSRKGKKSGGGAEKPVKQPQRGLGVAQLEKIRLQSQMMGEYANSSSFHGDLDSDDSRVETMMGSSSAASSSSMGSASASSPFFSPRPHHLPGGMIGYGDGERRSFSCSDQYPWPANYSPATARSQEQGSGSFNYSAPAAAVTLPLLEQSVELQQHGRSSSMGSISGRMNIYSDSNEQVEEEEVDLELRLSL